MDYMSKVRTHKENMEYYIRMAEEAHAEGNSIEKKKKECVNYQRARDHCYSLSTLLTGMIRERYIKEGDELDAKIHGLKREISEIEGRVDAEKADKENARKEKDSSDKSKKDVVDEKMIQSWYAKDPGYGFDAVAGMEATMKKMKQCANLTRHTVMRSYLRLSNTHSFLLYGPPGCGKTYLARAFAHELMQKNYKYLALVGADILSRYVGDSEKIVKALFEEARKSAPCIVFVDEFESVCRNRAKPNLPEYTATLTTAFLNGYNEIVERPEEEEDKTIIFIGATNYLEDVDAAMIDRMEQVQITMLDQPAREGAFRMRCTLKEDPTHDLMSLEDGFTYEEMARKTEGFNRRDINRLMQNVYTHVLEELDMDDDEIMSMMYDGDLRLTRDVFDECLKLYNQSRSKNDEYDGRNEPPKKAEEYVAPAEAAAQDAALSAAAAKGTAVMDEPELTEAKAAPGEE